MQAELIDIIPVENTLGEGVTWDPRSGILWWTDIEKACLFKLPYPGDNVTRIALPERLGSFALTEDPFTLVCAFASGFYLFDTRSGVRTLIVEVCADTPGIRLNDGRLDRAGRFWAGSMVEDHNLADGLNGHLYCLENGQVSIHLDGIKISNGLAWSRKSDRMYFADSPTGNILSINFNLEAGTLSAANIFATLEAGTGPDGAIVDAEDYYWSAHWGGGQVVRYNPDGVVDFVLKVPNSPNVTCAEFGGPDLNHLFVTSAKADLDADDLVENPSAGHLFIFKTDVKAIAQTKFYSLS